MAVSPESGSRASMASWLSNLSNRMSSVRWNITQALLMLAHRSSVGADQFADFGQKSHNWPRGNRSQAEQERLQLTQAASSTQDKEARTQVN